PELWHADTGRSEALPYRSTSDGTAVPLSLEAERGTLVVFRKGGGAAGKSAAAPALAPVSALAGPWQVTFQPDRGAPARMTLATLAPLNENT
ncbi:hypothetical protein ACSTLL_23435, partial [Vibrio parahaemolyticus]